MGNLGISKFSRKRLLLYFREEQLDGNNLVFRDVFPLMISFGADSTVLEWGGGPGEGGAVRSLNNG